MGVVTVLVVSSDELATLELTPTPGPVVAMVKDNEPWTSVN